MSFITSVTCCNENLTNCRIIQTLNTYMVIEMIYCEQYFLVEVL